MHVHVCLQSESSQAHEDQCTLRTPEDHDQRCTEVEGNAALSKEHGINSRSLLNELQFFHVASGALLPDIMHDVLEGALPYESKLMLIHFMRQDRYFQLDALNDAIENFQFGYTEVTTKPTPVTQATMTANDHTLKQNGNYNTYIIM